MIPFFSSHPPTPPLLPSQTHLNMFMCCGEDSDGLSMKQSRLVPASSLPLGVGMRRDRKGDVAATVAEAEAEAEAGKNCSSSHISAMLSLYPPPQSSTLSPAQK